MGELVVIGNTAGQGRVVLPAIIAGARKRARTRFLEFFTVNIRNPNTRAVHHQMRIPVEDWDTLEGIAKDLDLPHPPSH